MQARPIFATVFCATLLAWLVCTFCATAAFAIGAATDVALRVVSFTGGDETHRPTAMKRLAWEVRQRTSVVTELAPAHIRLSDPKVFESPFLYWTGATAFPPLSAAEAQGLRRFVEFGGFVWIDDAAPETDGFDGSVRRELARAFGTTALAGLPSTHVIFRSFYLVQRLAGLHGSSRPLEGIERGGRVAVAYTRSDVAGALERDNVGNYTHAMPSGERELATRLAVNFVLYALCLDYKDDQVHAPFILRRWAGAGVRP